MSDVVLDYSAGFPGAVNIRKTGYRGAVRYIGYPDRRKCTTAAELVDFKSNGLGMALVYENNLTEWRGGYASGQSGGQRARNHANAIGFPDNRPIYMAIDQDVVSEVEFNTVVEHLRGAASAIGGMLLTGVYGEADVMDRVRSVHAGNYFWQTAAWSRGRHAQANLYQKIGTVYVGGVACDENNVLEDDWGQHNYGQLGDVMTKKDVYDAVAQLIKDTANGDAEDLRKALVKIVWTPELTVNSAAGTAENLLAGAGNISATLTDAQIETLSQRVAEKLNTTDVGSGGVSIDQVEDAVRSVVTSTTIKFDSTRHDGQV